MPEAIHYCDRCGKIIKPTEIESGVAIVRGDASYCATCVATLPAEQKAALASSRPAKRPSPARGRPSASSRRHRQAAPASRRASPGMILGASAAVGLVAGLIAVVMMMGDGEEPAPAPSRGVPAPMVAPVPVEPTAPVAPAPAPAPAAVEPASTLAAAPAAASSPAAARLDEAKQLIDPGLNRYDEARAALAAVARDFPATPEASAAERLVTEIDARYAKVADAALKDATDYANDLASKGRFEAAASALKSVQARFRGSKWYVTTGQASVTEALAAITRMGKEAEEKRNRPLRPEEFAAGAAEIINDFETERDLKMFSPNKGSMSLSREHVTHGVTSMRVPAGTYLGGWPIVNYRRDWSGFDTLQIDIYNDTGAPAKVLIRVWDEASADGGDQEYWNRHNSGKTLREGANVFNLDLGDLYRGESGKRNSVTNRNIDLDKIKRFDLGFKGTQGAFYLDTMRLVRAVQ